LLAQSENKFTFHENSQYIGVWKYYGVNTLTIIWKQRQDLRIWNIVFTVANLN